MTKDLNDHRILVAVIVAGMIIGVGLGYALAVLASDAGVRVTILLDDRCEVCNKGVNRAVEFLNTEMNFDQIPKRYVLVSSDEGKRIYRELLDNNVNRVPAIIFEGDLTNTAFYKVFDQRTEDASRFITKAGKYHLLAPIWITRIFDPRRPGKEITVYFDANVERDAVEGYIYGMMPDADLELVRTNDGHMLRFETEDEDFLYAMERAFLGAKREGKVLAVPYIDVELSAQKQAEGMIIQILERFAPNVRIRSMDELEEGSAKLAVIESDNKDLLDVLERIFLEPKREQNSLIVPYFEVNISANKAVSDAVAERIAVAPNIIINEVGEKEGYFAVVEVSDAKILEDELKNWKRDGSSFFVAKKEKPRVELFVMSYCPYGLQAEKAIIPVLRLLGDKIDFKLRFVNYIMHGEKETQENLRQHCIQSKVDFNRFVNYLECFAGSANAEKCMEELKINREDIDGCMEEERKEYNIGKSEGGGFPSFPIDDALNKKYGVRGSPALVVEGVATKTPRNPEALKSIICGAILNPPKECDTELPSTDLAPGFGGGFAETASAGQCG